MSCKRRRMPKSIEASRGAAWPTQPTLLLQKHQIWTQPAWQWIQPSMDIRPCHKLTSKIHWSPLQNSWEVSVSLTQSKYIQVRWTRHCNRPLRKSTSTRCPSLVETKIYCMDKTIGYIKHTQFGMNDNVDYILGKFFLETLNFAARLAIGITVYWKLILHFSRQSVFSHISSIK